ALKNFQNWTAFTIEIAIARKHSPEVYFNFVKHILLSGQNLLTIFKSLNRYLRVDVKNLQFNDFSDKFLENLRLIVIKTKKVSSDSSNSSLVNDLIASIKSALSVSKMLEQLY